MLKAIAMAMLISSPAYSAPCAPRDRIIERLADKYSETQRSIGIINSTTAIEVWVAPDGLTFTVLTTDSNGISCLITAGSNWQTKPAPPKGEGL